MVSLRNLRTVMMVGAQRYQGTWQVMDLEGPGCRDTEGNEVREVTAVKGWWAIVSGSIGLQLF